MSLSELAAKLQARLNGPHADEDTTAVAYLPAEAVRYLNYASGFHAAEGLEFPGTVYSIAGGLSASAARMPQLFGQLTRWLYEQEAAGLLGTDDGGPVADVIADAVARLKNATELAARLDCELGSLQNVLAGLNGRGPNRRLEDES